MLHIRKEWGSKMDTTDRFLISNAKKIDIILFRPS